MHKLKGDTLVEVALAIGIFSLVAITVVSVVSASTSSAQSALETTITREEIDAQAEALRFIHESYISGEQGEGKENPYENLWNTIKKQVAKEDVSVSDFKPAACSEIYKTTEKGSIVNTDGQNIFSKDGGKGTPFIINIRQINKLKDEDGNKDNSKNIVVTSSDNSDIFYAPTTYPRIIYGKKSKTDADEDNLYNQLESNYSEIKRVEGLYIVAVPGKHDIFSGDNPNEPDKSIVAYYDFYIRSCWMPVGSDRASTISTVVRLYNPEINYKPKK